MLNGRLIWARSSGHSKNKARQLSEIISLIRCETAGSLDLRKIVISEIKVSLILEKNYQKASGSGRRLQKADTGIEKCQLPSRFPFEAKNNAQVLETFLNFGFRFWKLPQEESFFNQVKLLL